MFGISQPSEPRTIHVTMSGGGTRAALASGGANLALLEAKLRGDIAVASMTAVSGSAIMLARLLIAGGRSVHDLTHEDAVVEARRNVHGVWQHGFWQAMGADAAIGFVFADGAVLDNLGIGVALTAVGPGEELLVVDASAPVRTISDRARLDLGGRALIHCFGFAVIGSFCTQDVVLPRRTLSGSRRVYRLARARNAGATPPPKFIRRTHYRGGSIACGD